MAFSPLGRNSKLLTHLSDLRPHSSPASLMESLFPSGAALTPSCLATVLLPQLLPWPVPLHPSGLSSAVSPQSILSKPAHDRSPSHRASSFSNSIYRDLLLTLLVSLTVRLLSLACDVYQGRDFAWRTVGALQIFPGWASRWMVGRDDGRLGEWVNEWMNK